MAVPAGTYLAWDPHSCRYKLVSCNSQQRAAYSSSWEGIGENRRKKDGEAWSEEEGHSSSVGTLSLPLWPTRSPVPSDCRWIYHIPLSYYTSPLLNCPIVDCLGEPNVTPRAFNLAYSILLLFFCEGKEGWVVLIRQKGLGNSYIKPNQVAVQNKVLNYHYKMLNRVLKCIHIVLWLKSCNCRLYKKQFAHETCTWERRWGGKWERWLRAVVTVIINLYCIVFIILCSVIISTISYFITSYHIIL